MAGIGLDIGTTTISAVMIDAQSGEVLKSCTKPNRSGLCSERGMDELQDPQQICGIIDGILEEMLMAPEPIVSIGITGQMHGILYLNADGDAVSPLYTWRDECGNQPYRDGKSYAENLSCTTGYAAASGFGCTTHYYHFINRKIPAEAVCFCSIQDYAALHLTGRHAPLVHSSNAASFGLFDFHTMCFDHNAFQQAGMDPSILPSVTSACEIVGYYKGKIPVSVGVGDNQASFLGSVRDWKNSVLLNMGTGSQITFAAEHYAQLPGLECRPCMENLFLQAGSSLCGGRSFALLEDFFRKCAELVTGQPVASAYPGIDRCIAEMLADQAAAPWISSLAVSTKFCGTRSDPYERGSIMNIGTDNFTPQNMIVGFIYGAVSELYDMYRVWSGTHSLLIGSGNGLRSNRLMQQIAEEIFGMRLYIPAHMEEAAFGAALVGLVSAGCCKNFCEAQRLIRYISFPPFSQNRK